LSTNRGSCSRIENTIAASSTRGPRPNSRSLKKFKGPSRGSGEGGLTPSSNGPRSSGAAPQRRTESGVAGATERGRESGRGRRRTRYERRHLGPKAADALDGATEARGHRRGRPATDGRVTRVPEASPPNAIGVEKTPARKATPPKGRRGNSSIRSLAISTDSGRAPGNWTRTAERSTPVLLERAGEIAVKKGDDRSE
jgi:hypothetical protein